MAINRSRRNVIKAGLAGVAAVGANIVPRAQGASGASQSSPGKTSQSSPVRMSGPLFFDVETTSGVVRGMANTGIKIFRGIPYGADTGGKNRFMPPRKPA